MEPWYEKHHIKNETPEFVRWFIEMYGNPCLYEDSVGGQDEYWTRRAFALMGWNAQKQQGD